MTAGEGDARAGRAGGGGSAATVVARGEIDLATAPELAARLDACVDDGHRVVAVDLAEVSFIDSSGLAVLVGAMRRLRSVGGDLVVRNTRPRALRLLDMSGLAGVLNVESDATGVAGGTATP